MNCLWFQHCILRQNWRWVLLPVSAGVLGIVEKSDSCQWIITSKQVLSSEFLTLLSSEMLNCKIKIKKKVQGHFFLYAENSCILILMTVGKCKLSLSTCSHTFLPNLHFLVETHMHTHTQTLQNTSENKKSSLCVQNRDLHPSFISPILHNNHIFISYFFV